MVETSNGIHKGATAGLTVLPFLVKEELSTIPKHMPWLVHSKSGNCQEKQNL